MKYARFFFSSLFFSFFNLTLFPALNRRRGVYTLRYNRICTGGYLLSMGVSITSTCHKLRHPYRVNTFEFISAASVVPHLRICFFTYTPIHVRICTYIYTIVDLIYSAPLRNQREAKVEKFDFPIFPRGIAQSPD